MKASVLSAPALTDSSRGQTALSISCLPEAANPMATTNLSPASIPSSSDAALLKRSWPFPTGPMAKNGLSC